MDFTDGNDVSARNVTEVGARSLIVLRIGNSV